MKRFMSLLMGLVAIMVIGLASQASAESTIGYVDLEKIVSNYDKAQSVMADIKVKEAELRKLQADFVKQIEEARKGDPKNPVSSSQLEKKLNEEMAAKVREYRDWTATQQKEIDTQLESVIQEVAAAQKVDVVLASQVVIRGGTDITNEVLAKLNQ